LIWAKGRLSPTMHQARPAGERMFVDYAGQTFDLIDGGTGEIQPAQIFVAVPGASSYTPAFAGAGSMPRRAGRRRCRTGSARMQGARPSWAACRRSWCPTTPRACPAPAKAGADVTRRQATLAAGWHGVAALWRQYGGGDDGRRCPQPCSCSYGRAFVLVCVTPGFPD
jgi:transposase